MDGAPLRPAPLAAYALEALAASESALWNWSPDQDALTLTGAARALGLGLISPSCSSAALLATVAPEDRTRAEALLRDEPPGVTVSARLRMRSGHASVWRGSWLEDERRATGLVLPVRKAGGAERDPLTGLLTRAAFLARLADDLFEGGRKRVVVVDLARLRRLNEALGLERADLLLAALGGRLAAAFPPESAPARVADGAFALLLESVEASDDLRSILEEPLRVAGFDLYPTFAVGSAESDGTGGDALEVLRRAELAVEASKASGGAADYGRALETVGLSRLALASDIRGALVRGEIIPFFQPIVRLQDACLVGFEALARWRHPRRGLLPPDEFLPLLSEAGLIPALERTMVDAAAGQLARWRRAHPRAGELSVSVNLSTGEIGREGLVHDVITALDRHGLPHEALKLEITEGEIMRDPERAEAVLDELRAEGVQLALDDFGMGFSSLSYLTRLPLQTLKIDRYFVRTMAANAGSEKIVRSVATLARELGLEVTAEGVETVAAAQHLLSLGCHYGQGFGYSPPLDAPEAEVYLNEAYLDGAPLKARA